MLQWLTLHNVAAVVSILGAAAALWAAVNARGARQAAQAVRESARRRSLVEELSRLLQRSRTVVSVIRASEFVAAQYLCDEVSLELKTVCSRYAFEQPERIRTAMLASQRHAAEIAEALAGGEDLESIAVSALLQKADACAETLSQALGHCHAAIDQAVGEETS